MGQALRRAVFNPKGLAYCPPVRGACCCPCCPWPPTLIPPCSYADTRLWLPSLSIAFTPMTTSSMERFGSVYSVTLPT